MGWVGPELAMQTDDYTEAEHIELYEERAAIREHDGGMRRSEAEQAAYYDWRAIVGRGAETPEWIRERAGKFGRRANKLEAEGECTA